MLVVDNNGIYGVDKIVEINLCLNIKDSTRIDKSAGQMFRNSLKKAGERGVLYHPSPAYPLTLYV